MCLLGSDVNWQVLGAQNFTPNGNTVEVEWGAPGQGEVTVVTSGGGGNADPLQIFCGQGTSISVPGNPSYAGFVQIIGGVDPIKIILIDPDGVLSTSLGTNGYNDFSNIGIGTYSLEVTSADGQTATCSFYN